jgi:hypothetical protein
VREQLTLWVFTHHIGESAASVNPKLPLLAWRQGLARTVLRAIEEVFGSSSALNAHGGIPSK